MFYTTGYQTANRILEIIGETRKKINKLLETVNSKIDNWNEYQNTYQESLVLITAIQYDFSSINGLLTESHHVELEFTKNFIISIASTILDSIRETLPIILIKPSLVVNEFEKIKRVLNVQNIQPEKIISDANDNQKVFTEKVRALEAYCNLLEKILKNIVESSKEEITKEKLIKETKKALVEEFQKIKDTISKISLETGPTPEGEEQTKPTPEIEDYDKLIDFYKEYNNLQKDVKSKFDKIKSEHANITKYLGVSHLYIFDIIMDYLEIVVTQYSLYGKIREANNIIDSVNEYQKAINKIIKDNKLSPDEKKKMIGEKIIAAYDYILKEAEKLNLILKSRKEILIEDIENAIKQRTTRYEFLKFISEEVDKEIKKIDVGKVDEVVKITESVVATYKDIKKRYQTIKETLKPIIKTEGGRTVGAFFITAVLLMVAGAVALAEVAEKGYRAARTLGMLSEVAARNMRVEEAKALKPQLITSAMAGGLTLTESLQMSEEMLSQLQGWWAYLPETYKNIGLLTKNLAEIQKIVPGLTSDILEFVNATKGLYATFDPMIKSTESLAKNIAILKKTLVISDDEMKFIVNSLRSVGDVFFLFSKNVEADVTRFVQAKAKQLKELERFGVEAKKVISAIMDMFDLDRVTQDDYTRNAVLFARAGISYLEWQQSLFDPALRTKLEQRLQNTIITLAKQIYSVAGRNIAALKALQQAYGLTNLTTSDVIRIAQGGRLETGARELSPEEVARMNAKAIWDEFLKNTSLTEYITREVFGFIGNIGTLITNSEGFKNLINTIHNLSFILTGINFLMKLVLVWAGYKVFQKLSEIAVYLAQLVGRGGVMPPTGGPPMTPTTPPTTVPTTPPPTTPAKPTTHATQMPPPKFTMPEVPKSPTPQPAPPKPKPQPKLSIPQTLKNLNVGDVIKTALGVAGVLIIIQTLVSVLTQYDENTIKKISSNMQSLSLGLLGMIAVLGSYALAMKIIGAIPANTILLGSINIGILAASFGVISGLVTLIMGLIGSIIDIEKTLGVINVLKELFPLVGVYGLAVAGLSIVPTPLMLVGVANVTILMASFGIISAGLVSLINLIKKLDLTEDTETAAGIFARSTRTLIENLANAITYLIKIPALKQEDITTKIKAIEDIIKATDTNLKTIVTGVQGITVGIDEKAIENVERVLDRYIAVVYKVATIGRVGGVIKAGSLSIPTDMTITEKIIPEKMEIKVKLDDTEIKRIQEIIAANDKNISEIKDILTRLEKTINRVFR